MTAALSAEAPAVERRVIEPREFRDIVGLFPTGVAIVTMMTASGEPLGQTVSSFTSVSLDPPLVSFALATSALSLPAWFDAESFAVNILEEGQEALSTRFARSRSDKWSGTDWSHGPETGAPLLAGSLATIECRRFAVHDAGDHALFLGHVCAMRRIEGGGRPLVFHASRYHRLHIS